jgi:hypothetical protein
MNKKRFCIGLCLLLATGVFVFAGDVSFSFMGATLSYSWSSDKSLADDAQVKSAVEQGLKEGYKDGLKDKNSSSTTHYGDSYSRSSFRNSYVQDRYHDAYMEGFKKGAGKPPSSSDTIYW